MKAGQEMASERLSLASCLERGSRQQQLGGVASCLGA
jgi:hypothetical protein